MSIKRRALTLRGFCRWLRATELFADAPTVEVVIHAARARTPRSDLVVFSQRLALRLPARQISPMGKLEPPRDDSAAPHKMTDDHERVIEEIRLLFREDLDQHVSDWEHERGVPAWVFERLGAIGAFRARWPNRGRQPGRIDVAATIAREASLISVGAAIAISTHTEAYFSSLARSKYGERTWHDALAGRAIGALAISESGGGSHPTAHCETRAERASSGWVLHGHKQYVSNMRAATDIVVFAQTGRARGVSGFSFFIVPKEARGITVITHQLTASAASATAMLELDRVEVPDERRVGSVGSGVFILLELLCAERLAAACGALAMAELCFEIALAYADRRLIDGVPLRQRQAVGHKLASLATEIAAGRALVAERLLAAHAGRLAAAEACQAKLMLSRVAWRAADDAVQMLGGLALLEQTPLARIWRDVRVARIGGGTDEVHREIISRSLRSGELRDHPAVLAAAREARA